MEGVTQILPSKIEKPPPPVMFFEQSLRDVRLQWSWKPKVFITIFSDTKLKLLIYWQLPGKMNIDVHSNMIKYDIEGLWMVFVNSRGCIP